MIYIPKYFTINELFPPSMIRRFPEKFLWGLFNPDLLRDLDAIRDFFGKPVFVNYNGMHCRGYRDCKDCKTVGASLSMHRFGGAVDFNIEGLTAEETRRVIVENQNLFTSIRRMERGVNWVHIDISPTGKEWIVFFEPN